MRQMVNIRDALTLFARWWKCADHHRRLANGTVILAGATLLVALAGVLQLMELRSADVAAARAWIAPIGASQIPEARLRRDAVFPFVVNYINTGKEPAIDVNANGSEALTRPPPPRWRDGEWSDFRTGDNKTCDGLRPIPNGAVIYPTNLLSQYSLYRTISDISRVNQIEDGGVVLVCRGCFAYRTMNSVHQSAFCFYLKPVVNVSSDHWVFNNCPDGSFAN